MGQCKDPTDRTDPCMDLCMDLLMVLKVHTVHTDLLTGHMDLLMVHTDLLTVHMDLHMVRTDLNNMVLLRIWNIILSVECTAGSMDMVDLMDTVDLQCPNILVTGDPLWVNISVMARVLVAEMVMLVEELGW